MASIFSATGISLSLFVSLIAGEPEPELFKDAKETAVPPLPTVRPLESEKSFYYFGESLRQAMADDLQERHQRLLSRSIGRRPLICGKRLTQSGVGVG